MEPAHDLLRCVLARRLALSSDENWRICSCTDLETLERWHDQAITAENTAEALATPNDGLV